MSGLRVGGLVPLTTLDYPGQLACVLFCQGCAWRCRYCHNPHLVPAGEPGTHAWSDVMDFLRRRQGLLQAVVFSGGEPTLQGALPDAMAQVRELGFRVGLHSAGIRPAAFARALAQADWVGFDIKALPEDHTAVTGVAGSGEANWSSLELLLASGVAHEVRVTVHWHLLDPERLWQLATRLRERGVATLAVQLVRTATMLDDTLPLVFPPRPLPPLWLQLAELFPRFTLRDT